MLLEHMVGLLLYLYSDVWSGMCTADGLTVPRYCYQQPQDTSRKDTTRILEGGGGADMSKYGKSASTRANFISLYNVYSRDAPGERVVSLKVSEEDRPPSSEILPAGDKAINKTKRILL